MTKCTVTSELACCECLAAYCNAGQDPPCVVDEIKQKKAEFLA